MNMKRSQFTPIKDDSPSSTMIRFGRQVAPMQFLREAVQNSIEAGATKIKIEPCPMALHEHAELPGGIKRLSVLDNGVGMNADQLLKYINKYNSSSKISGGHHDNFGIGIKATAANFNHYGLVFISWTRESDEGNMIWLCYNKKAKQFGVRHIPVYEKQDDGEYELTYKQVVSLSELEATYEDEGGFEGVKWWNADNHKNKHKTIKKHGTIVYFCGMHSTDNTWCRDASGKSFKEMSYSYYLNKRFNMLNGVSVGSLSKKSNGNYQLYGFEYHTYALGFKKIDESIINGFKVITLFNKNAMHRQKNNLKNYNKLASFFDPSSYNNGFIAVKYKNELYNLETGKRASRQWGIIADEVMSQVKIIVIPPEYDPKKNYGVFPNEGRDTLMIEDGSKDQETKVLDLKEIREHYVDNMPQEVSDAIDNALKKKMNFKHSDETIFKKYKFLFKLRVTRELEEQMAADKEGEDQLDLSLNGDKTKAKSKDKKDKPELSKKMKEKLDKLNKESLQNKKKKELLAGVLWEPSTNEEDCRYIGYNGFSYPMTSLVTRLGTTIFCNPNHDIFKQMQQYFVSLYKGGDKRKETIMHEIQHVVELDIKVAHAHKMAFAKHYPQLKVDNQITNDELMGQILGYNLYTKVQQALTSKGLKLKK
tara:strand:- start:95 stop:2038 length:1944 start_codon:yes stop_codon:yes gene_type:complete